MGSFNDGREKTEVVLGRSRDSTFDPRELEEASNASLINRCFVHVVFLAMKRRGDKLQSTSGDMDEVSANFAKKSSVKSVIKVFLATSNHQDPPLPLFLREEDDILSSFRVIFSLERKQKIRIKWIYHSINVRLNACSVHRV